MKRKVAVQTGPRKLEVIEENLPHLEEHDVLIETLSIGVCHSDLPQYLGEQAMGIDHHGRRAMVKEIIYPAYIGHEPVGRVLETGSAVTRVKPGDYVGGALGGFASHNVTHEKKCILIPSDTRNLNRCLAEPLACLANIIQVANPALGDYVAVIGCGVMGLLTLSGLSRSGAAKIIAIDFLDSRLELAMRYGAAFALNPQKQNLDETIYELTQGRGVDVAVEITGSLKGLGTAAQIIRYADMFDYTGRGKILIPSLYGRTETWDPLTGYNLMFRAPILYSTHPWFCIDFMRTAEAGVEAYRKGILPIDRLITHEFPLEKVADGFELMVNKDESYLKGIVIP
jgi:threonine dehydrogenase-like Zn-dependent dehydrogenase